MNFDGECNRQRAQIQQGQKVRVIDPPYAANLIGRIIGPEESREGAPTGRWLVRIALEEEMILALFTTEFIVTSIS